MSLNVSFFYNFFTTPIFANNISVWEDASTKINLNESKTARRRTRKSEMT